MSAERERRILISAGAGIFSRLTQMAGAFITLPIVLHALGPAKFGIWGAATSLAWLGGYVDFGIGSALVTLIATTRLQPSGGTMRENITAGLAGACLLGLGFLVIGLTAIMLTTAGPSREAFAISVTAIALYAPLSIASALWLALQKAHIASWWDTLQAISVIALTLAAAYSGAGLLSFCGIIFLCLLLSNAASLWHLLLTHPELRPRATHFRLARLRALLSQGSLYFAATTAAAILYILDNVLTLALLGPQSSARMAILLRICVMLSALLWSMVQPLWPAFADAAAEHNKNWILQTASRAFALSFSCTLAGGALLVAFGGGVLQIWLHQDLGFDRPTLLCIALWLLVLGPGRILTLLLNALSMVRFQAILLSLAAALALALKFALAPRFAALGILMVTPAIWAVIIYPALAWRLWQWKAK